MQFFFINLIICFFAFLYILYFFSRDDFVLERKGISTETIFSTAFLSAFFSLFSSRFFFALFSHSAKYANPLVFLDFPYFPGLSLIGGLIGESIFLYAYSRIRKLPVGKIFDLFSVAFICVLPPGFLISFVLFLGKTSLFFNILFLVSILMFLIFTTLFYKYSSKGEIKDGSLGLIFLSMFSFIYFVVKLFLDINNFSFKNLENLSLLFLIFLPLIFLINQEIMDKFLPKK